MSRAAASPGDEVGLVHHVALLLVLVPGLGLLQHGGRAASRGLTSLGLLQLAGQRGDQGELSAAEMPRPRWTVSSAQYLSIYQTIYTVYTIYTIYIHALPPVPVVLFPAASWQRGEVRLHPRSWARH